MLYSLRTHVGELVFYLRDLEYRVISVEVLDVGGLVQTSGDCRAPDPSPS